MKTLHDPSHRGELVRRLESLTPNSERKWGKMSVDQMLWHVGDALARSLGEISVSAEKPPIPGRLLKFIVLNLPWGKNGPTHSAFVAKRNYDFTAERRRCLQLIDKVASRELHSGTSGTSKLVTAFPTVTSVSAPTLYCGGVKNVPLPEFRCTVMAAEDRATVTTSISASWSTLAGASIIVCCDAR